jgi:predicted porin
MKKSLLALAVLGAFAGVASAQSSVTIFGVIDVNLKYVDNTGTGDRKSMGTDGINSNRLGFRGIEDLGGGMKAGFWLEGGMSPDDGTAGGQNWRRRSTVSLMGNWGEVRLGRDYTPSFWNTTIFDPFGTNGVGSSLNVARAAAGSGGAGGTAQATYVRSNNALGYFLPAMGGVYGQIMIAPSEGATGAAGGQYEGGRIGYAAGPFNVALALAQQGYSISPNIKYKTLNLAGSYKFGATTLMIQYNDEKLGADAARVAAPQELAEERWLFGASIVVGQGEVRLSYVMSDWKNDNPTTAAKEQDADASMFAIGYVYNLSPRTALYAQYSKISNEGVANFSVAGGSSQNGLPTAGGSSTGMEFGLRHSF